MGNQGVPHRNRFTPCWHKLLIPIYSARARTPRKLSLCRSRLPCGIPVLRLWPHLLRQSLFQPLRGQIIVMTESEARSRYPDLVVASLGVQRKQKPGGKVTARVLFDGTHGLCVNSKTRLRDQERAPIAADLKRSMREKPRIGELTFALSADVTEAHRQVPFHPDDWHLLGCQVSPGGDAFVNTVGTFGIASASYYWSQVAAAIGRLVQYLSAYTSSSWHMLVADDYLLESGAPVIALDFFYSSYCALLLECLYRGTRHAGETLSSGSVLSCYCARDVLEFRQVELSGSSVGRSLLPARRRFTWDPSRRG